MNILTTGLPFRFAGRTKSLLARARSLSKKGIKVQILTINANDTLDYLIENYKSRKLIDDNIQLVNVNEFYRGDRLGVTNNYKDYLSQKLSNWLQFDQLILDNQYSYLYEKGIARVRFKRNVDTQNIERIDLFSPNEKFPIERLFIDKNQNVAYVRYYKSASLDVKNDLFLDFQLNVVIEKSMSKNRPTILRKNKHDIRFENEKDFYEYWFEEYFDKYSVIINDVRFLDKPLLKLKDKAILYQLHNAHLADAEDIQSETKGSFQALFNAPTFLGQGSRIISLTKGQADDIVKKYPQHGEDITIIPHARVNYDITETTKDNHIVIVSRLDPQKNLKDAITAFDIFHQDYPDFILDIWGYGSEEKMLHSQIKKLKLGKNVILHGLTKEPWLEFQKARFSIITSLFEGFSLSALESISNGTPVVTYDVNWGPSEIIDENSGIVTKENTPESLAESMAVAVNRKWQRDVIIARSNEFSQEKFVSKWISVIELVRKEIENVG